MPATGYLRLRAYESYAQLPLKDVAVTITADDGTAIALRLTDRSGVIAGIPIPVPDRIESQSPGTETPFTTVTVHARKNGYQQIRIDGVQLFADVITQQDLELIPISELPSQWSRTEDFQTTPQNL